MVLRWLPIIIFILLFPLTAMSEEKSGIEGFYKSQQYLKGMSFESILEYVEELYGKRKEIHESNHKINEFTGSEKAGKFRESINRAIELGEKYKRLPIRITNFSISDHPDFSIDFEITLSNSIKIF